MNTFKRLPNGDWGVSCDAPHAAGDRVEVTKRNGGTKMVTLGEAVPGFTTIYTIQNKRKDDPMPRTPSMTSAEAETAIGHVRGTLPIIDNGDLRGKVRKWFSARGLPRVFVDRLTIDDLRSGYNLESHFKALSARYETMKAGGEVADDDDDDDEPLTITAPVVPAPEPALVNTREAQLIGLLREVLGSSVNREQVQAIISESLKGVADKVRDEVLGIAPRTVEISIAGAAPVVAEGVHPCFERVLKLVLEGTTNIILIGPAGCGKTTLAQMIAKTLSRKFVHLSGSAGISESQLMGWLLPIGNEGFQYVPSPIVKAYEAGKCVICFDEFDAFDQNMALQANTMMGNGHMSVPQRYNNPVVERGEDVAIIATANTMLTGASLIYTGRNAMDGASDDRFLKVEMDYDRSLEGRIGAAGGLSSDEMHQLWSLREKVAEHKFERIVSTRAFQKASAMKRIGDDWKVIMATLTKGWTADELSKCGVRV